MWIAKRPVANQYFRGCIYPSIICLTLWNGQLPLNARTNRLFPPKRLVIWWHCIRWKYWLSYYCSPGGLNFIIGLSAEYPDCIFILSMPPGLPTMETRVFLSRNTRWTRWNHRFCINQSFTVLMKSYTPSLFVCVLHCTVYEHRQCPKQRGQSSL